MQGSGVELKMERGCLCRPDGRHLRLLIIDKIVVGFDINGLQRS
ncbi:hypothetical protein CEV32_4081 [Brucella rhizosphaerae]|uniref:Uncharacterized protein n=1 Tax=Brucella rhizosphaerae TaxID=571254 RepID=A0A256FPM8_9HYPH|nr:hypothetical protein CEV32_4081 [Brucella rhizosphaerae]